MKIVVQNFKSGKLSVAEAPAPRVRAGTVLVRTATSLISAGTDRAVIALAKKGYLGKALDRPDLARKVINKARTDGLWPTYKVVKNLISEPIPLGYSLVGRAIAVGAGVHDIAVGDRVACAGLGHANHAEIVAVPRNLCVAVPDGVSDEQASYVTLGAIAMHGMRQADQQFGATVLVVGLGLVGLLTVQMARAAGYRIIGLDIDPKKLELARRLGTDMALAPDDPNLTAQVRTMTRGIGADAVLLTVGSRDSGAVFEHVAALARDRAKVVVVGDIKMDISRRTYFEKELEILQSRSYGPGRYDKNYEEGGQDYPVGYVRWTEGRNLQAFLDLIAAGRLDPAQLTTHRYSIDQADEAYQLVTGERKEFTVGVVLGYAAGEPAADVAKPAVTKVGLGSKARNIGLGIIGTGQFAKGVLLPAIVETGGFKVVGVASARGLSADAVAGRYKAAYATTDARRVLDDPAITAVVVATRHDSHGRYVIEALERGKHVFVEKPLCVSADDLPLIEAAARRSSGTLTVGFNRRHSPMVQRLIEHFAGRAEPMALVYRVNAGRIALNAEQGWVHDASAGGGPYHRRGLPLRRYAAGDHRIVARVGDRAFDQSTSAGSGGRRHRNDDSRLRRWLARHRALLLQWRRELSKGTARGVCARAHGGPRQLPSSRLGGRQQHQERAQHEPRQGFRGGGKGVSRGLPDWDASHPDREPAGDDVGHHRGGSRHHRAAQRTQQRRRR